LGGFEPTCEEGVSNDSWFSGVQTYGSTGYRWCAIIPRYSHLPVDESFKFGPAEQVLEEELEAHCQAMSKSWCASDLEEHFRVSKSYNSDQRFWEEISEVEMEAAVASFSTCRTLMEEMAAFPKFRSENEKCQIEDENSYFDEGTGRCECLDGFEIFMSGKCTEFGGWPTPVTPPEFSEIEYDTRDRTCYGLRKYTKPTKVKRCDFKPVCDCDEFNGFSEVQSFTDRYGRSNFYCAMNPRRGDLRIVPSTKRRASCEGEFLVKFGMDCRRLRKRWERLNRPKFFSYGGLGMW